MFSKRTSVAAAPASEPPPPAVGPDRSSTASTTTTSRSSIFSTFSAISAISAFSNKSNATATKSASAPEGGVEQEEEEFNPVDITPPIAPGPTVTDASVFFPRNPNSKHLAHLTALNTTTPSASVAPSTNASTVASASTSPAPSVRASVQSSTTATAPGMTKTTLNLPPLTLPSLSTPTTPTPFSAHGPISPTPSTMSHFSFSYAPSFHGSVVGISNLPNIPQATVTRLVQTYFTIQALKVVGYQAAVAGRCAGIVHRVPFAFGGAEEAEEEDWELGGGDLFGDSGVDLVLSRMEDTAAGETVEGLLARRFPQWFYLEDREIGQEILVADNASILSGEAGVSGHRRTRSHPNPGEIAHPDATSPPPTAGGRSRSGTITTITPPPPQKQLFFHDPSNLLNASFAAFSFSSPSSASGATPPIDFSSVISFAADHPPPPVSPTVETTTSSAAGSEAGDDIPAAVTLRTPLAIHLHHLTPKPGATNQKHPYTWLPALSQTTLATPNPTIGVELGGIPHPIPVPTLPLPTLLITSLLTAYGLLRSLSMGDRKIGNIALRQAVNLASFIRMRGGVGSAAEGGGVVSLPGGVPKDALGVLARLRGEKGNEERRVVLWALRSGVVATDPPRTPGGTPVAPMPGKHQHPGGLKRTYTAGANSHLRELVLVNRREGEGWRRSAPAAVMDYRPSGGATPSVRSFSGVSVTSMGPGRNSMGYVEEEQEGEDGEMKASSPVYTKRESVDSQAGEMAELRREMGSETGSVMGDKELLSPVEPPKRGASLRWSFKGWGGASK